MSRPARALWIEIMFNFLYMAEPFGRGPRGPCGLKFALSALSFSSPWSRPARALWIEMLICFSASTAINVEAREGLVD